MHSDENMQRLLEEQLALNDNIAGTAQLLRFILSISNENLLMIKARLECIRDLVEKLDAEPEDENIDNSA